MDTIAPSEISSGNAVLDFTVGMPDDTMTRALADDAATIAKFSE